MLSFCSEAKEIRSSFPAEVTPNPAVFRQRGADCWHAAVVTALVSLHKVLVSAGPCLADLVPHAAACYRSFTLVQDGGCNVK